MPARDLITGAVEAGQDGAGHSLAASMGDAERCALVDACLGAGRLKAALLYVREFQLHDRRGYGACALGRASTLARPSPARVCGRRP